MVGTVLDDATVAARLASWYDRSVPGFVLPFSSVEVASAGRSNVTLIVRDGAGAGTVVRHPPLLAHDRTSHDVVREGRIMRALAASRVPVPEVVGICEDTSVIGAPFVVMRLVSGKVLDDAQDAEMTPYEDRLALNAAMATHLGALHRLDPPAIGLSGLGREEGYIGRQLRRWSKQWRGHSDHSATERFKSCQTLLEGSRPADATPPRVVHGDYRLGNVIVRGGTVAAVLDWELTTLGHPLSDLAYLLNNWVDDGEATGGPISSPTQIGGFGTREELVRTYEEVTGAPVDRAVLRFFRAFSYWRLASIRSGVVARLATTDDPVVQEKVAHSRRSVPQLIDAAMVLMASNQKEGL